MASKQIDGTGREDEEEEEEEPAPDVMTSPSRSHQ